MRLALILGTVAVLVLTGAASGSSVQKVTLTMRDFGFSPQKLTLAQGIPVELTIVNKGKVAHEFMAYEMPRQAMSDREMDHDYIAKINYFRNVEVKATGGKVRRAGKDFIDIRVATGKSVTLAFTPLRKGTFEIGCMLADHYQAGMRGVLVVK